MSSAVYLFVYGTLKRDCRKNRFSRYLSRNAEFIGEARMPGRIYGLRRYPAMRPPNGPGQEVRGEIFRLLRPKPTLSVLDAYEDIAYRRLRGIARLADGAEVQCWVYVYARALPDHRQLASGEWRPRQ